MGDDPVLLERLRRRGWRLTPQRRAIAQALEGSDVHLSADQVLAEARRTVPEVSTATVYNTLNELVGLGEVQEVRFGLGATRYDPNVGVAHHHLLCLGCGTLHDVHPEGLTSLRLAEHDKHGFEVGGVDVVFRGHCPSCLDRRVEGSGGGR